MKVLHLNDYYQRVGGAETILFNTLDALEEQGIVNVVVHEHPTPIKEKHRHVYEVPSLSAPHIRQSSIISNTLGRILQEEKPDLVHIHDIGNPEVSEISRYYAPTIQSMYNHNYYCPGGAKYLPLMGRICERPFGRACLMSAFLTHCNSIRPRLLFSSYYRTHHMVNNNRGLLFLTLSHYQAECVLQSGYHPDAVKV
ncbi:MAG: glycosyltransferase, partial [Candidatus Binatia bacterium]